MQFLDARRLTGPSLLFDTPAAVLDVACEPQEADDVERHWRAAVEGIWCAELDFPAPAFARVDLTGGVSLAFTAPIDALYTASAVNELAWAICAAELCDAEEPDRSERLADIRQEYAEERNPALLRLQARAADEGVTFLWDDDDVSLGLGRSAKTWPARECPDADALDWSRFADVPIGLVTGTNGKTTSVRLAVHILRGADLNVGLSSTDWIAVNEHIIDRGDWSGPGGARSVLRRTDVDVAVLESARGGLLRRGLGVERADAALITNIAEDHLGDFGSRTVDELLEVKWIVSRAVRDAGRLILNADDARLVARAAEYDGDIVWFSLDAANPVVAEHRARGGLAFVLDGGELLRVDGGEAELICRDREIPITLKGAARHNTANSLAAAALCHCLGASTAAIRAGLTSMSQDDNPGRCNVYDVRGRRILVDFAHNPAAMQALFDMAEALPAKRRVLCFGQAGDRPDALIREMTRDAYAIGLDHAIVSELPQYHRGREHGEVYKVIRDELEKLGMPATAIEHAELETEALTRAFDWADEGDLIIMLALGGAEPVQRRLRELGG